MRRGEISKFNARKQMGGGTIPGPEWHYQAKKPGILQFATPPEETVVTVAEIGAFIRTIPPNHVYVHGRTTNLSTGYLHDMCEYVVSTFDDIEVVSADLVVLNDIIASPGAPRRFASAGDAGAPVRLRDGRLVGFVREHNPDSSVTYVTLAEPLLRRIAQVAGAERATMVPCWDTRWHGVKGYQYV